MCQKQHALYVAVKMMAATLALQGVHKETRFPIELLGQ